MDPLCEMHKQDDDRDRYRQQVCQASLNTASLAALLTKYLLDYRHLLVSRIAAAAAVSASAEAFCIGTFE